MGLMRRPRGKLMWLAVFIALIAVKTVWNRHAAIMRVTDNCAFNLSKDASALSVTDASPVCNCVGKAIAGEQAWPAFLPFIGSLFFEETDEARIRALIEDRCFSIGRILQDASQ